MPVTYSARAAIRRFNATLSVPARARSVLNASSSTLNVSASVQPWRNASTTGCMATGVAWIRAIRLDMPVSSWPLGWMDRGRGAMHHSTGRMPWLYSMSQGMLAYASVTVWTGFSTRSTYTIGHPDEQSPFHVRAEPVRADTPVHAAGSGSAGTLWRHDRHQRERQSPQSLARGAVCPRGAA